MSVHFGRYHALHAALQQQRATARGQRAMAWWRLEQPAQAAGQQASKRPSHGD